MAKKENKEEKSERKKEEEKIDATKEDEKEPRIVESFLESIPLFGGFFKELGKTEVFKKRFEEADKQIQENLRKGDKRRWGFEAHISTRPIIRGEVKKLKEDETEFFYGKDYWYAKKENMLTLSVKVPGEKVQIRLEDDKLILKDKDWEKIINLPDKYRNIKEKQYRKNFLAVKLIK